MRAKHAGLLRNQRIPSPRAAGPRRGRASPGRRPAPQEGRPPLELHVARCTAIRREQVADTVAQDAAELVRSASRENEDQPGGERAQPSLQVRRRRQDPRQLVGIPLAASHPRRPRRGRREAGGEGPACARQPAGRRRGPRAGKRHGTWTWTRTEAYPAIAHPAATRRSREFVHHAPQHWGG